MSLTHEREKEIRHWAYEVRYTQMPFGKVANELLAEIDRLRDAQKKSTEWRNILEYTVKGNGEEIAELEQKLAVAEKKFLELELACENHSTTMGAINVHMGYQFTQPLINFKEVLSKIRGGK